MLKLLAWLIVLSATFAAGYWAGQRPIGELGQSVTTLTRTAMDQTAELSRKAVEKTSGMERQLRMRQGLVDAKERLIEAKSNLLDKNYGAAAKNLDEVVADLQRASDAGAAHAAPALTKARAARDRLAGGRPVPRTALDDIMKSMNEGVEQAGRTER